MMIRYLRKLAVLVAGIPLIIGGIILIPLPGPGLLFIVAGLFVLALEFEWAKRHLETARRHLQRIQDKATGKSATSKTSPKDSAKDSTKRL
jgi:uncharacterized protein (TIGR02611 family)